MSKSFVLKHTDWEKSPYTGMDRQSWLEAAEYLLEGFFGNISSPEDPPLCPRAETAVTYPHLAAPREQQEREKHAEVFEGLARSLFIGSVLIRNNPDAQVKGCGKEPLRLRDYYSEWILKVTDPADPWYVGDYASMRAAWEKERGGRSAEGAEEYVRPFQQTVECGALVIGLDACRQEIWDQYSQKDRDRIAVFLSGWGHAGTAPQNWRLFNMLVLAFLSRCGYPVDEKVMQEHASAILNWYVGDGWYRDGQSFDFYSCWGFGVYAPLWCRWYGYEHAPETAAAFEEHSNALMKTYPDFFDRDGWTLLWGRSSIYRNAAASALDADFFLEHPEADPGRARRIASGCLLQFLLREDFLADGVPSLGFYGAFPPLIQPYSCAESVYWLGKAFLCLCLPEDHPFWTEKENNGTWEKLEGKGKETVLSGPGLCYTNHGKNGETILRSGKVLKAPEDAGGRWEYEKLCYNTKYPWGADLSQEYVLTYPDHTGLHANVTFWGGVREGVLYRKKFFDWKIGTEAHWTEAVNLADFPVPCGIFRCDLLRLVRKPVTVALGSYSFPDNGTQMERRKENGAEALILKGRDHMGRPRQMAMTVWTENGWDGMHILHSVGTNPDSRDSVTVYGELSLKNLYDAAQPHLLLSQVITKESLEDFAEEELFPVREIVTADPYHTGACGPVTLKMKDGTKKRICFEGLEGRLSI